MYRRIGGSGGKGGGNAGIVTAVVIVFFLLDVLYQVISQFNNYCMARRVSIRPVLSRYLKYSLYEEQ